MQRRHLRRIVIAGVSVLMIGSMGSITAGISHATPDDTTFTQTEARLGGATPAYTGAGANANDVTKDADRLTTSTPADANQGSFLNAASIIVRCCVATKRTIAGSSTSTSSFV